VKQSGKKFGLWRPHGTARASRSAHGVRVRDNGSLLFTASDVGAAHEMGAIVKGLLALVLICGVALVALAFVFGHVIPLGSVGVRKIAFGPGQGLAESTLKPGYHWTIPGYSAIYSVPQTVQVLEFDRDPTAAPGTFGALNIPTVDGTTLDVDVTLFVRFYGESGVTARGTQHGGPSDLINKVGSTEQQWRRYLSQVAENELKRALSALSTVDFYNPERRERQVDVAQEEMRKLLDPMGVEVVQVLPRRYTYREEIDQAIFKKNLQELEISFNKVAGEFAEAQKQVNQVEAEGSVRITNLQKQAAGEVEKIRSEGDLYVRQKQAEGDLLVAKARAEVDTLRNEVLTQVGSDTYVALQLAKLLSSFKGGVVPGIDPFDFDTWVKKLSGGEGDLLSSATSHGEGVVEIDENGDLVMPPHDAFKSGQEEGR
jgi:regulator of protease activity HflC (stomatin/prohibitin superfamily)